MLPYQPNCDSLPAPPAWPPPAPGGFFTNSAWAIFFSSTSASVCSSCVLAGVGFIFGDGFGDALAKIIFLGEGLGVGFGFGVGFGGTFTFGVGFGEDIDAGDSFALGN